MELNLKKYLKKILNVIIRNNEIEAAKKINSFGSEYGNWKFIHTDDLHNSIILSAGVGEDISFDVEFINFYNSTVIFVDPTPRALEYLETVKENFGLPKSQDYQKGGFQYPSSYNLTKIKDNNFIIYKKALWSESDKELNFYFPENERNVSNTLINSYFEKKRKYIKVETISLEQILKENLINKLELIKVDIEGAEIEVIASMLNKKIFPNQLLLEIDYLRRNTIFSIFKSIIFVKKILNSGYKIIKINNYENYLFVRNELLQND